MRRFRSRRAIHEIAGTVISPMNPSRIFALSKNRMSSRACRFGSKSLESLGLRAGLTLARDVIKEPRLRDEVTNMITFGLGFETPVRPGLHRLISQFGCSPHPVMTKRTVRVSASGDAEDGVHSSSCTSCSHALKPDDAGRSIFGLKKGMVMGVANA